MTTPTVRLTRLAKRAGCAAKHPPGYLFPLVGALPPVTDPNVLVGSATADDAAVYRLTDELALVLTTDFFTPVVDAPYDFGRVAAANALSDVYAMGGRPIAQALNLVGFPDGTLEASVLGDILRGGADKARDAGIDIVGGHTIKTDEPIYGLAVTGLASSTRRASSPTRGGRPGDALVPHQAPRGGHHHDRGQAGRGHARRHRRSDRADGDAQPVGVRGDAGGRRARGDGRDGLRPAGAPAQRDEGERVRGDGVDGAGAGPRGGASLRARRDRAGRDAREPALPRGQRGLRRGDRRGGRAAAVRRTDERGAAHRRAGRRSAAEQLVEVCAGAPGRARPAPR